MEKIIATQISSLDKVFLTDDRNKNFTEVSHARVFKNERYSYQLMYTSADDDRYNLCVSAASSRGDRILLRSVGNVPVELAAYQYARDEHYLSHQPGLYPDPLFPLDGSTITADPGVKRSLWVTVFVDKDADAGVHTIEIKLENQEKGISKTCRLELEVIDAVLPESDLIYTQWFHTDCIASYYKAPVFSQRHWQLIEKFIETAAYTGINMILTPVFTPPLDTEVGGERPTVQLVKITKEGDSYTFDFTLLSKWVKLCKKYGIRYFEMAHLFSQWGAKFAPKIVAFVDGEEKRIFGWDTPATSREYANFLKQFLPALTAQLREEGVAENTYFHISDEPTKEQMESYRAARELVAPFLKDFKVIDALSDYEFYESGLVPNPIPANNHMERFLEHKVKDLWTYYCCVQNVNVSNRFMAMPSYRNRILGTQLYKYDIIGFLHWGYNFYYTQFSKKEIDPYVTTDAGFAFASGDSYSVYPYTDGPIESLRSVVFYEGLQDMRALKLLESYIGKEKVMELLAETAGQEITFESYPHSSEFLLTLRDSICETVKKCIS